MSKYDLTTIFNPLLYPQGVAHLLSFIYLPFSGPPGPSNAIFRKWPSGLWRQLPLDFLCDVQQSLHQSLPNHMIPIIIQ